MATVSDCAPLEIREALPTDIPELCELLLALFTQEADFQPDAARQQRALSLILSNPALGRIYCAVQDSAVVGTVMVLFTVSTAEGGPAAWLEDMVVREERRGDGIGTLLLQAAICGAKRAGCTRITLLTDAANEAAIRFYGRAGFVRSAMTPLRLQI